MASDLGAMSLEALRKLEPEQFLKDGSAGTMQPIIDGYVLPEEPYAAFAAGRHNDVPILIGSNADEASENPNRTAASEDSEKSTGHRSRV